MYQNVGAVLITTLPRSILDDFYAVRHARWTTLGCLALYGVWSSSMQFSTSTSHSMLSQLHSSNLHTLTVCKRLMPAVTNAWSRPHIQSDGVCGVPRFFTTLETDDSVEEKMRLKRQEMAESLRRYTEVSSGRGNCPGWFAEGLSVDSINLHFRIQA